MVCPFCASSNIITVKGQGFCVNCGRAVPGPGQTEEAAKKVLPNIPAISHFNEGPKTAAKPAASPIKITPSTTPKLAAPKPAPKPVAARVISDIARPTVKPAQLKPATALVKPTPVKPQTPVAKPAIQKTTQKAVLSKPRPEPKKPAKPKTKTAADQFAHIRPIKAKSSLLDLSQAVSAGLIAAALVALGGWAAHLSRALTPGEFSHFLATRALTTKIWLIISLPGLIFITTCIVILWLWQRASAVFALSRLFDHRPIAPLSCLRAGWNSLAEIVVISILKLLDLAFWLIALALLIKLIGGLALNYWAAAGLGVGASIVTVLAGLWVWTALVMAEYLVILSGQPLSSCFKQGFALASHRYSEGAGTALGLVLLSGSVMAADIAGMFLLDRRIHSPLLAGLAGAVLALLLFGWLASFSLHHWVKRYRHTTRSLFGSERAPLYLAGRRPVPVSRWGSAIAIAWWLLLAAGATWLLWRWQLDPSRLLDHLAATIY